MSLPLLPDERPTWSADAAALSWGPVLKRRDCGAIAAWSAQRPQAVGWSSIAPIAKSEAFPAMSASTCSMIGSSPVQSRWRSPDVSRVPLSSRKGGMGRSVVIAAPPPARQRRRFSCRRKLRGRQRRRLLNELTLRDVDAATDLAMQTPLHRRQ